MPSDKDLANSVAMLSVIADKIRTHGGRMLEDAIAIGNDLIKAKAIVNRGNFRAWLEVEFRWSINTAQNFMNVAEVAGKSTNFVHLNIPLSASYLLAAPSTPPDALEAVAARAAQGQRLSLNDVKEEIARAKPFSKRGPITAKERLARGDAITEDERLQRGYEDDVWHLNEKARNATRGLVRALERFAGHGMDLDRFAGGVDEARLKILSDGRLEMLSKELLFFQGGEEALQRALVIIAGARAQAEDEAEIDRRVRQRVQEILDHRDAEDAVTIAQANALIAHYKGRSRLPFTAEEYLGARVASRLSALPNSGKRLSSS